MIEELSLAGVKMGVMMDPMIPGLNEQEMQGIMKAAADAWCNIYHIHFYTFK